MIEADFVFSIALPTVSKGKSHSNCHGSQRRKKQNQNAAADRALPISGCALHSLITHGATLRECWNGRS